MTQHRADSVSGIDRPSGGSLPDRLGVLPWHDPSVDPTGFDPRSAYVETFWLPVLGPSTTLLLRRLADLFDDQPDGFDLECARTSRELGLGRRLNSRSPFVRAVDRTVNFGLAQLNGQLFYVRRRFRSLSRGQAARLSPRLRSLHDNWTFTAASDTAGNRRELERASHLARTLIALGERDQDVERQLQAWRFSPAIAWHAVQLVEPTEPDLVAADRG